VGLRRDKCQGTLNLLELCHRPATALRKFRCSPHTSTCYGAATRCRSSEDATPTGPFSPTPPPRKAGGLCWTYHHLYGLDVTILVLHRLRSAGSPDMSLFRFVQWIYEDRPLPRVRRRHPVSGTSPT